MDSTLGPKAGSSPLAGQPKRPQAIPSAVDAGTRLPAFGTYAGELAEVNLRRLAEPYRRSFFRRLLVHKRWHYVLMATRDILASFAIVDLSYAANAFVSVVDLQGGRVLFDASFMGLPGLLAAVGNHPGEGLSARFVTPGARLACARGAGHERYTVAVQARKRLFGAGLRWRGDILGPGGDSVLTVISPLSGGSLVNVTQKRAGLSCSGTLRAGGREFGLDGGVAGLDYTQGYLARRTAWRWAMGVGQLADGTPVGLNLAEGINDETDDVNENALWVGTRLVPLGRARFDFNRQDVSAPWQGRTTDGAVELQFSPIFVHREERNYKLIKSRFAQPQGTFTGRARVDGQELDLSLAGVTEEQDVLW